SPVIVQPGGGSQPVSVTLPEQLAFTGPTLAVTLAANSVSETFSMVSHPGMHCFSVSGSLSRSQTSWRGAGMRRSPVISMRVVLSGRGKGECGSPPPRLQRHSYSDGALYVIPAKAGIHLST